MTGARYIVSRRDGARLNLTQYLRTYPVSCEAHAYRWTSDREAAWRFAFDDAASLAGRWNARPADARKNIQAKVEDADAPEPVTLARAA